jgi:predicted DsbA family dithiol-disulfide isomerase
MRIEVYDDVLCPFTHVGLRRLVEARERRHASVPIRIHAWPLEWVNGQPLDRALVKREIDALRASVAPELFAGFDTGVWPRTSLPAFGLAESAYAHEDATGEGISLALRDAVFEEGLDISDMEVLRSIGAPYGVTPIDGSSARFAVERDYERGRVRSVRGSPHFFVGDQDWFCPTLDISHRDATFAISLAEGTLREFYDTALSSCSPA